MEKLAIIELNTTNIKLLTVDTIKNKSYVISNELSTPINLSKGFDEDEIIKSNITQDIVAILNIYKRMIEAKEITNVLCVACSFVKLATNQNGFLNEIEGITGFAFRVITPEDEINYVYSAAINTIGAPKALVINVEEYSTQFLVYNRRNVQNMHILPIGSVNLPKMVGENINMESMRQFMASELKSLDFLSNLEEEFDVIGFGAPFLNAGAIGRRARKYPLDVDHNYLLAKAEFEKVFDAIKPLESTKSTKIKGVSVEDAKNLQAGLAIVGAVFGTINKSEIAISKTTKIDGLLLNTVVPITQEKPITDNLGYSLQVISEYYDSKTKNAEQIYTISMILFKQLKVLHKLSRSFVRVLRVASYLCQSGKRVDYYNNEKASFNIILNSKLYGISHSELVLAGFVSLLREADNFNMPEWVKYRELVSEEDLDAVKKLSCIIKIAESLDVTKFSVVTDINCDILGDSVIMKTITNGDASLEIKHGMLNAGEFKRAFGKNLEVL